MGEKLMRIGIDIKCLRYNNSGIGRYLKSLLDALQELDQENDYYLFSPRHIDYPIKNPHFHLCPYAGKYFFQKRLPGILWQQFILPALTYKYGTDILWGPEQTLPLRKCKGQKLVTVHDFVYRRFPETMQKSVLWINSHIGEKSIATASRVLANSEFTKEELLRFFPNFSPKKIEVISCGISSTKADLNKTVQREKQLLFVGSLEPRKNLTTLIKALEILAERGIHIPLVMTGPSGWKNEKEIQFLKNTPIAKDIHHLGFVSDEKLRRLYATSSAIIFPSFYEGFGLPVLEALQQGTPVLTTKDSVMQNIAGNCGIYFDAHKPESIANAIEGFFKNEKPWDFLKDKETERQKILEKYQWNNSARQLIDLFSKLQNEKQGDAT